MLQSRRSARPTCWLLSSSSNSPVPGCLQRHLQQRLDGRDMDPVPRHTSWLPAHAPRQVCLHVAPCPTSPSCHLLLRSDARSSAIMEDDL